MKKSKIIRLVKKFKKLKNDKKRWKFILKYSKYLTIMCDGHNQTWILFNKEIREQHDEKFWNRPDTNFSQFEGHLSWSVVFTSLLDQLKIDYKSDE